MGSVCLSYYGRIGLLYKVTIIIKRVLFLKKCAWQAAANGEAAQFHGTASVWGLVLRF